MRIRAESMAPLRTRGGDDLANLFFRQTWRAFSSSRITAR